MGSYLVLSLLALLASLLRAGRAGSGRSPSLSNTVLGVLPFWCSALPSIQQRAFRPVPVPRRHTLILVPLTFAYAIVRSSSAISGCRPPVAVHTASWSSASRTRYHCRLQPAVLGTALENSPYTVAARLVVLLLFDPSELQSRSSIRYSASTTWLVVEEMNGGHNSLSAWSTSLTGASRRCCTSSGR
jgi:hypothetical protein